MGSFLIHASEEHSMIFPSEVDAEGRWIVPASEPIAPRGTPSPGVSVAEDLVYMPPLLPDLPYNPFKALVVPRPIGWISTRGESSDNLSPYSFFGYLSPSIVFFGAGGSHSDGGGEKDALKDSRTSGVFCVNVVPWRLRLAMSASSAAAPRGADEFLLHVSPASAEAAAAEAAQKGTCEKINAPCVSNAPLRLECEVMELVKMTDDHDVIVIGKVVHVVGAMDGPVASRGGYMNYFRIASEHCFAPEARASGCVATCT
mmetsp:Transcript_7355/g.18478  ORF Transcript_7355/g.18478 Transcript_7355/m.18478 type:complete len:258 (-) Transcript_7355:112-885(-)